MRILIGVNTLQAVDSQVYSNHCQLWYRLGKDMPEHDFIFFTPHRMSIDAMRNQAAKMALQTECDYLLFIDDDCMIPSNVVQQLISRDQDIVAGLTYIRGNPFNVMHFRFTEDRTSLVFDNAWREHVLENGLIPCDALGFSCCLIRVELLRHLRPPFFVTGSGNTEDVYFCLKARRELDEVSMAVDSHVKVSHLCMPVAVNDDNVELHRAFWAGTNKPKEEIDRKEEYVSTVFGDAPSN